mmetsp:Transcript_44614/g.93166  ORF Transcript_44614/g.93166 Transcript_44614/m.93166 type:complete len:98 (-) Transcript_44614:7-300(-)
MLLLCCLIVRSMQSDGLFLASTPSLRGLFCVSTFGFSGCLRKCNVRHHSRAAPGSGTGTSMQLMQIEHYEFPWPNLWIWELLHQDTREDASPVQTAL